MPHFFVVSIDYCRQEQILTGKDGGKKKKIKYTLINTPFFKIWLKKYRSRKLFVKEKKISMLSVTTK